MILHHFDMQSNAADWNPGSFELIGDDDNPLWATVPGDIKVTLTIGYPRSCCANNSYLKKFLSTDSPQYVAAQPNGVISIEVPAVKITDLEPEVYPVFVKIETGGNTDQAIIGELPIVQGA